MPKINTSKGEVLNAETASAYIRQMQIKFGAESTHDLAMKVGLEPTLTNDFSRGVRNPTVVNIVEIANKLNENPHDVLTALTGIPPRGVGPLENQVLALWANLDETSREMMLSWLRDRLQSLLEREITRQRVQDADVRRITDLHARIRELTVERFWSRPDAAINADLMAMMGERVIFVAGDQIVGVGKRPARR